MIKIKFRKLAVNGIPAREIKMSKVTTVRSLKMCLENGWISVKAGQYNDDTINSILSVIDPYNESDWIVKHGENKFIINRSIG